MKTTCVRMRRLATALAVVVVGGGLAAAAKYIALEREIQAHEAFTETVQFLWQEQKLNMALASVRGGDVEGAARHLDALLCGSVRRLNNELASANAETQTFVEETRQRIALGRPWSLGGEMVGAGKQRSEDETASAGLVSRAVGRAK